MNDIYDQIDNLYQQIELARNEASNVRTDMSKTIEESAKKIKELRAICKLYAENIYNFLGIINKDHLDTSELIALDGLQKAVDMCIDDISYKEYLNHKYVLKDYDSYIKARNDAANENMKSIADNYIRMSLCDNVREDDTDTIVILDKK